MNLKTFLVLTIVSLSFYSSAQTGKITTRLQEEIDAKSATNDYMQVSLLLEDRVDIPALDQYLYAMDATPEFRAYTVITSLKDKAAQTQENLLTYLRSSAEVKSGSVKNYWITNVIFVEVRANFISHLALRNDIAVIDKNARMLNEIPVNLGVSSARTIGGHEPGLDAINAPAVWALGYTGYGRTAMNIDTGVNPDHDAIDYKWRGNFKPLGQSWFVNGVGAAYPDDCDGHGSHTMGTMVGLEIATSDTIGVAFGAQWIGANALCTGGTSSNIAGFEWALDPDSNALTITDMPDVINNSWYDSNADTFQCNANNIYASVFDALEAAGIAVVFSSGNNGPGVSTITAPKNISTNEVNVFCVGNLDGNNPPTYPIASSSSRGPSICGGAGSLLIKPEVSAPGTSVRSCTSTGVYEYFSGTSMAAPHASGAILVLKEAFPNLTGTEIKYALYYSCTDLGAVGEDNDYGMGIINLLAAYNYLIAQGNIPAVYEYDAAVIALENISDPVCAGSVEPIITIQNKGTTNVTSVSVDYTYTSAGGTVSGNITWNGSLIYNASTDFNLPIQNLSPGNYELTVHLSSPNGQNDQRNFNDDIFKKFMVLEVPVVEDGATCGDDVAVLYADDPSFGTINWFNEQFDGGTLDTGNVFVTPPISSNTTYWAQIVMNENVGEPDTTNASGGFYDQADRWLIFDCFSQFILKSVKVYAQGAGDRTIEWRNSGGTVITDTIINLIDGEQRVNLNFVIDPGTDYQLAASGTTNMYRQTSGLNYPYAVPGVMSIRTTNSGSTTNRYYFFYDWEIEYGSPCGRFPVEAVVAPSTVTAAFTASNDTIDIGSNPTAIFTDNSINADEWNWDFGDGNVDTQQNPSHNYSSTGNYLVTLIAKDINNCPDTTTINLTVINTNDINEVEEDFISVYPNPVNQWAVISTQLAGKEKTLIILNSLGTKIYTAVFSTADYQLLTADWNSGVYLIKIKTEDRVVTKKLIKM